MYSWLWAKLKLCQYKFIMVTRRAQNQVKETLKQPYQTTVSIKWLSCFSLMQQVTMKYAKNVTTWGGRVDWNLHFHLLKEFHWNYDVIQKATWQSNIKNHQCKYKALCICIYIYTVFAIAVYLDSTYTLIYTWSTNWHNESLYVSRCCWAKKGLCHSCTKTTYQKTIELKKASNQE